MTPLVQGFLGTDATTAPRTEYSACPTIGVLPLPRRRVSYRDYTEGWRSVPVHRERTAVQLEGILRLHVYPRLGDRPIGSIRRSEVQALIRALSDELAPGTVGLVYKWVRTIFRAAVSDRVISETPCRDIQLPSTEKPKVHPWEPERVIALVDAVPDRYRALVLLGAGTGVRISEALGLTVDRVDWMRRTVRIDRQLVGVKEDEPVFGPVKDRKNRPRTIPLPDAVLEALVEHCSTFDRHDGLLFVGPNGGPVRPSTCRGLGRLRPPRLGSRKVKASTNCVTSTRRRSSVRASR